ncbi:MAG: GTPase [Nocardioidaceae bacterium]
MADRIDGLAEAGRSARGWLDDTLVDEAQGVAERAGSRLRLSGDHTVVALAGATGSGKSSTFNALTGVDLAPVGVRRPTTSWTMACAWGADGAGELLDWLGVPLRHQVSRTSMLGGPGEERGLDGLVLLDLPDHDSTEVGHHLEVDRLVRLVDLMVWVLDPQKYADAALHRRYLAPLAGHRELILVALNHIDTVPQDRRSSVIDDLRRLLAADGLTGVPVLPMSAVTGEGLAELKREIATRVAAKQAARARLMADVRQVAARMAAVCGDAEPGRPARARRAELTDAFADAAGVPTVVKAVQDSTRRRARRATGWPLTAWLGRFRPDPLRRLHLDLGVRGALLTAKARSSIPEATPIQRARVDAAVRQVADDVGAPLTPPWAGAVRRASSARLPELKDRLDRAVLETDLGLSGTPLTWRVVRLLQWVLLIAAIGGLGWLAVLAVLAYLRLPEPTTPRPADLPLPTLLLLGGVLLGVLLALVSRYVVGWSARRKARAVDRRLRSAISEVTELLVVEPIDEVAAAYRATLNGLATALR